MFADGIIIRLYNDGSLTKSSVQINVGIIAACAVSLRPLVSALLRCRSGSDASRPSSAGKVLESRRWAMN